MAYTDGKIERFSCFMDPDDCGSNACLGDFQSILTNATTEVWMMLCVPEEEENTAAIWEINISKAI